MLISLAFVFLAGLAMASVCQKMKLPRIIGMLLAGVALGPYAFNILDDSILGISADLRQMALVIILIKAGLSLNIDDLKKVGRPAILMSFLPAIFEILAFVLFAPVILRITWIDAAVMGAVLGAVSPAVVVPRMVQLMETKYGTQKGIPQLILAGASLDDVFVVVLFSTFIGAAQGNSVSLTELINIPVSIVSGIFVGAVMGIFLSAFFEMRHVHKNDVRNSEKVMIILGTAFLLTALEEQLKQVIPVSGLLAVMSMACMLQLKSDASVSASLSEKFGKLWIAAEVILFVLVGAAVDIRYTLEAGLGAVFMIFISLIFRSVGVCLCLIGAKLNLKEKVFCIIAYLPKATVQAAIGSVPLSLGLPCGNMVLSVAVLSIIITAPIGAFCMDMTYQHLLEKETASSNNTEKC
ncbi:MAG: cation:proton antiporter [Bacteroidales bacterium]|nr:cation:proton antiporter [Clostridium sp.]MCM1204433.1 cation:proton antiporter [Bacteroidales bacterium]